MSGDKSQIDRFRDLGCDESEERFDAALRKLAKAKEEDQNGKETDLSEKNLKDDAG